MMKVTIMRVYKTVGQLYYLSMKTSCNQFGKYSQQPEINMVFVIFCVYHFLHGNLRSNVLFILNRLSILIEVLFAYSTILLDMFAKICDYDYDLFSSVNFLFYIC